MSSIYTYYTAGRYHGVVWFVGYNSNTGCLRSELDCKTLSEPLFVAHMLSIPFYFPISDTNNLRNSSSNAISERFWPQF